jgi:hypothetical protein
MEVDVTLCDGASVTYILYESEEIIFCGTVDNIVHAPDPSNGSVTSNGTCDNTYRTPVEAYFAATPNAACDASSGVPVTIYAENGKDLFSSTVIYESATNATFADSGYYRQVGSLGWKQWDVSAWGSTGTCASTTCYKWRLSSLSSSVATGDEPHVSGVNCAGQAFDFVGIGVYEFCASVGDITLDMPNFSSALSTTADNTNGASTLTVISQDC